MNESAAIIYYDRPADNMTHDIEQKIIIEIIVLDLCKTFIKIVKTKEIFFFFKQNGNKAW